MTRLYQPPILLWITAFVSGAALGLARTPEPLLATAVFGFALLGAASAWRVQAASRLGRATLCLLFLLTPFVFGAGLWRAEPSHPTPTSLANAEFDRQPVVLRGVVLDAPVFRGSSREARIRAESVQLGGEEQSVDARVQLTLPAGTEIAPGDRLLAVATLESTGARPGREDDGYRGWLAAQGVAALGTVQPGDLRVIERTRPSWWRRWTWDAREAVNDALRDALPPPLSGLAQGMVTGQRQAIDGRLRDDLNRTSLSHLIVVSGANLTLLTAIVMAASSWIVGRRPAAGLAMLAALAYAAFAGGDPPVLRALGMALVFSLAHMLGRSSSARDAVALAAAVMIGAEPQILRDVSFQLTLAGTLGLVMLMPSLIQRQLAGAGGLGGAIRAVALVSLVAMLATMPLIALHFQRISLVGLLANVLVAPLFGWMFLGSFAVGALGLFNETIAGALSWPLAWLPLRWLALIAEAGSELPGASQPVRDFGPIHAAVIYAAMAAVAIRPRRESVERWNRLRPDGSGPSQSPALRRSARPLLATGVLTVVAAALWLSVLDRDGQLKVHFIDVGQGDAALIVAPQRQTILIDTGGQADALLAGLREHLPAGSSRIDLIVITHPQSDHLDATWALLEWYDVGRIIVPPSLEQTPIGRRLARTALESGIPLQAVRAGTRIAFSSEHGSLSLDVLWPLATPGFGERPGEDPNANGIVARLRYGSAAVLFAADIGALQEIAISQQACPGGASPCLLQADVLKVAHHGSRYSTTQLLLDRVRPKLAVISVGAENPHGHPHPDTLGVLNRSGIAALTTAERGTISLRTDGEAIVWSTER